MFCSVCRVQVNDRAVMCPQCGAPIAGRTVSYAGNRGASNVEVKSHMVGAIIQLLVCIPMGAVSLNYACRVNALLAQGDFDGARQASKKAKFWIIFGSIVVVGFWLLLIIGSSLLY